MKLFYWNAWGMNFGDLLGPVIVEAMLRPRRRTMTLLDGRQLASPGACYSPKVMALGSILQLAGPSDIVWGTGMAPQHDRYNCGRHFPTIEFRAVRGPLTREFVQSRGGHCPEIFGDPAQLLPHQFPKYLRVPKQFDVTVIPHAADEKRLAKARVCSVRQPWERVVMRIAASRCVVSSSLHGVIVAEALGIPAAWLRHPSLPSFQREGTFKYNDYLLATNRSANQFVADVEAGVRQPLMPPRWDFKPLASTFPYEAFPRDAA